MSFHFLDQNLSLLLSSSLHPPVKERLDMIYSKTILVPIDPFLYTCD